MARPDFGVVVCGYNEMPNLPRALKGLIQAVEQPADLVFVDDASTDGSFDWVCQKYPDITRLRNESNKHYTGAYNVGLRHSFGQSKRYAVMVNADVEVVNPHFARELVDAAERINDAGFIGPKVYYRGSGKIQNTSLRKPSLRNYLSSWITWRLWPHRHVLSGETSHKAEYLNTVCCLIRKEAVEDAGYMDETMGIYYDDVEWMTRASEKGWAAFYFPIESVIHHEKPVGYEYTSVKSYMLKRNAVYYAMRRKLWGQALGYAILSWLLTVIRMLLSPLKGESWAEHTFFTRRLERAYWFLMTGKPIGPWFGPPMGKWK